MAILRCSRCVLPGRLQAAPLRLAGKELLAPQGTGRAMERQREAWRRCSSFGRSVGWLPRALFLALGIKSGVVFCGQAPHSKPAFPSPAHCLCSNFPAHLRVLEVASSDLLSTTPALPSPSLLRWRWLLPQISLLLFFPSHYLLAGGIALPIHAKSCMVRTSLGMPCV